MYTAYTGIPVISNMTYKVQFQNEKTKNVSKSKENSTFTNPHTSILELGNQKLQDYIFFI